MKHSDAACHTHDSIAGVILCGGRGSRMGRTPVHKVCCPLAGRPAIVRLVDTLRAEHVNPIVIVVGDRAGDVVQTVGRAHTGIHFVYQRDQLGTGHAARIGVEALRGFGYTGDVFLTMGDKWYPPGLVTRSLERFRKSSARLLVVSTPKTPGASTGRLVRFPSKGIVGIVEKRDIERSRILEKWFSLATQKESVKASELRNIGLSHIRPAIKLWRAMGRLARFCRGRGTVRSADLASAIREVGASIHVGHRTMSPDQVERMSPTTNQSIYIARADLLQAALRRVGRANAQDEYYLTDIIGMLADGALSAEDSNKAGVVEYRLRHKDDIMTFNTRAELARIAERVEADERASRPELPNGKDSPAPLTKTCEEWLQILSSRNARAVKLIEKNYGTGGSLIPERVAALKSVVRLFSRTYGSKRKCLLIRAPGRVNLMGRHIDHQGGLVHVMSLDRETLFAVSPRNDDTIRIVNVDRLAFPPRELILSDWQSVRRYNDWIRFVDSEQVKNHLASTAGDWSNYILASAVFQQHLHPNQRLKGMDIAVYGNVPIGAGLSSSSTMVVAAMEAIMAVNGIQARPDRIVEWCGQAEWFVGSRGGNADHAAIRLGKKGYAARIGFFPFRILGYVPIPEHAAVLYADSGQHAIKSAGARDRFNERVACYRLGVLLLKKLFPKYASKIERISDVSPENLGCEDRIGEMLASLPKRISRVELRKMLGSQCRDRLETVLSSHSDPGEYTLRDVVAFGVGECERSRRAVQFLGKKDLRDFGELMRISHDGDRVNRPVRDAVNCDLRPLYRIAGSYACSTMNIDKMVDIATGVQGVYAAQLSGAGLGGAITILADESAVNRVKKALREEYYKPRGLAPAAWRVRSVNGGGIIRP